MSTNARSKRVAIVVPPSNPTVEPELHRLLPDNVVGYVTRLPVHAGLDLADRLAHYRHDLDVSLESTAGLDPDAAIFACTGSSYSLDTDAESTWQQRVRDRSPHDVVFAADAIGIVLSALGVTSLRLVSPYPSWLTDQCVAYWRLRGVTALSVTPIRGSDAIYDLTSDAVLAAVDEALDTHAAAGESTASTALMVAGTGARSLEALDLRAPEVDLPLVSSNVAGTWSVLHSMGIDPALSRSAALTRLAQRIDAAYSPPVREEQ